MKNDMWKEILRVINQTSPAQIHEIARTTKNRVIGTEAIFDFIARLKGIDDFELDELLEQEIDNICYNWYVRWEKEMIDGESGELLAYEEILGQFIDIIPKVKFGKRDAFNKALAKAKSSPPPLEANQFNSENYRLLIALCYWLQHGQKDQPFFLTGKLAGEACGISQNRGAHMLRNLTNKGRLKIVKKGTSYAAARYWYIPFSDEEVSEYRAIEKSERKTNEIMKRLARNLER